MIIFKIAFLIIIGSIVVIASLLTFANEIEQFTQKVVTIIKRRRR